MTEVLCIGVGYIIGILNVYALIEIARRATK